jgi:SH3 domain-containing protein
MLLCMCFYFYISMNSTMSSGDTFVIISRARGWWVVQRDPAGTGVVDSDTSKQGWVPAGCLLETRIPVATAVAEASHASGSNSEPPSPVPNTKTPILPLHIVSTSFPGYALMDYKKKGDEELDLYKDDVLRVFKRYNHWSYVRSFAPGTPFICLSFLAGCKGGRRRSWLGSGAFTYTKDEIFMLTDRPCTFTILIVVVVHRQDVLWDTRHTECSSARYQQHFCQP